MMNKKYGMVPVRFTAMTLLISITLMVNSCDKKPVARDIRQIAAMNKPIVIALQPFKGFNRALTDTLAATIEHAFGFRVTVLPPVDLPKHAFIKVKTPRYRADTLIRFLRTNKPDSIDYLVGLTHRDISTTKKDRAGRILKPEDKYTDFGIFGLGYRPGPSCIISSERIRRTPPSSKLIPRLKKVVIHEIGHNLNLDHCSADPLCVMNDAAETMKTIDRVELNFCKKCKVAVGDAVKL